MTVFRFSKRARDDLRDIAAYTIETWDKAQADRYLSELENCCRLVASNPGLARKCDNIREGYRRMEEGSHVLFFKFDAVGALVVRVLHKSMMPRLQITDQDEDE